MLSTVLDVFRLRQYFNAALIARDLLGGLVEDTEFLNAARRALITLPIESAGPDERDPFPPFEERRLAGLQGKRVALMATGGSGALASVVGVARALEEAGVRPAVLSVCSGSSLFGFPIACGIPADEVAEFVLGMSGDDYVDVNWGDIGKAALTAGRGFAGFVKGVRIAQAYRRLVGDRTLGDLEIPCYAPIWNIEENRLEYIGPRTHPELPVATAIRVAIAIPLFIDPVQIGDYSWCDGGIVDIFPVHPVLDIEPPCDLAVAINGFYPPEFEGERAEGWREQTASVLRIASQVRTSQQIELARENLARLRESLEVVMLNPVPYSVVRGVGFYKQFLDRRDWPDFMRAGHRDAAAALAADRPGGRATRPTTREARTAPAVRTAARRTRTTAARARPKAASRRS